MSVISGRAIVTDRVSGRRVNLGIGSLVKATRSGSNTIKTLDKIEALDPFVVPKAAEGAKKELDEKVEKLHKKLLLNLYLGLIVLLHKRD